MKVGFFGKSCIICSKLVRVHYELPSYMINEFFQNLGDWYRINWVELNLKSHKHQQKNINYEMIAMIDIDYLTYQLLSIE